MLTIALNQLVSISDFRQNLSTWLDKVKGDLPVVIVQNSKPKAVLIDPDYLDYLEKYADGYYDAGDAAEAKRVIEAGALENTIPFDINDYL